MKLMKILTILATGAVISATPALAEKRVTISNWTSPNHATSRGHAAFAEMTEAEFPDAFDFKLFTGGALLGPKPTLSGLRDGVADVGLLALTYFRSEMPTAGIFMHSLLPIWRFWARTTMRWRVQQASS